MMTMMMMTMMMMIVKTMALFLFSQSSLLSWDDFLSIKHHFPDIIVGSPIIKKLWVSEKFGVTPNKKLFSSFFSLSTRPQKFCESRVSPPFLN